MNRDPIPIPGSVLQDLPRLGRNAIMVLVLLSSGANDDGVVTCPIRDLFGVGLNHPKLMQALKALVAAGYVERLYYPDKPGGSASFRLLRWATL